MSARRCPFAQVIKSDAYRAMACDLGSNVILSFGAPQHLLGNGARRTWLAAVDMEDGKPPEHRKELLRLAESLAELARPGVSFASFRRRVALRGKLRRSQGDLEIQL
jgi:hypothetical protein